MGDLAVVGVPDGEDPDQVRQALGRRTRALRRGRGDLDGEVEEVLLGYSQGAQVSLDVITGNSEAGGTVTAVSTAVSSHVVAIANFGDPGHVTGQSWDLGTATRNGLFPRSSAELRLLTAFGGSGKIAAWCDANDPYCASGVNLEVHLTYLDRYQSAAASFVLSKIGG